MNLQYWNVGAAENVVFSDNWSHGSCLSRKVSLYYMYILRKYTIICNACISNIKFLFVTSRVRELSPGEICSGMESTKTLAISKSEHAHDVYVQWESR